MPDLRWSDVAERAGGLHLLTGPASGSYRRARASGEARRGDAHAARVARAYSADRIAVEVQLHHAGGDEAALAGALIALAERRECRGSWRTIRATSTTTGGSCTTCSPRCARVSTLDDAAARGLLHPNGDWRLQHPATMRRAGRGREAGIEESERIASECDFDLCAGCGRRCRLSRCPAGTTTTRFCARSVYDGAHERWGDASSATTQQRPARPRARASSARSASRASFS